MEKIVVGASVEVVQGTIENIANCLEGNIYMVLLLSNKEINYIELKR